LPKYSSEAPARYFSSEPSLQVDSTEENGFKGHGMLAPFTAGWQSTDLHPLVIDRSEVLQFGIVLKFFSIDSQIIAQDLEHVAFHVDFSS
jgi:hypothetical protein